MGPTFDGLAMRTSTYALTPVAARSMERAEEIALIERCRKRDFDAFGKIVDAYQHRVMGFARRFLKDREEAADVTQEVFVRAYQHFDRFDGRAPLRTWLFRIAYNLCVDRARKADRGPAEQSIETPFDDNDPMEFTDDRWNPESLMLDEELKQVVENGIAGMSEKLRSVLILHDREDMQYEEIATALDIPIGTVKSRLFLARAHLKQVLTTYLNTRGLDK